MKTKVVLASLALFALLAFTMMPAVFASSGQIVCLTPTSCANNQELNLTGPGSTATATFELTTNANSGTTLTYVVCPQGVSSTSCTSNTGTYLGWSWTFTPSSGTTGSGSGCSATSCEGNGFGSPSTLSLSITAPSSVTSSNSKLGLTIYACEASNGNVNCATVLTQVASLTIESTVPEFGLGMGVAMVIGLFGILFIARKRGLALPSVMKV
ncbi:MAG: hypothetical protein JRN52_00460 [Nitrososphaerota archaeon]|nr:hypothetical protein [Nitrososphaerota archaeon]